MSASTDDPIHASPILTAFLEAFNLLELAADDTYYFIEVLNFDRPFANRALRALRVFPGGRRSVMHTWDVAADQTVDDAIRSLVEILAKSGAMRLGTGLIHTQIDAD